MSILILGMEMPTSCWDCEVGGAKQMDNATCPFYSMEYWEQENYQDKIADGCPLVLVPPHGDLIDRDALEMERRAENAQKGWHDSFAVVFNGDPYYEAVYDCTEQFKELVNNAPTIIPAEEGE